MWHKEINTQGSFGITILRYNTKNSLFEKNVYYGEMYSYSKHHHAKRLHAQRLLLPPIQSFSNSQTGTDIGTDLG